MNFERIGSEVGRFIPKAPAICAAGMIRAAGITRNSRIPDQGGFHRGHGALTQRLQESTRFARFPCPMFVSRNTHDEPVIAFTSVDSVSALRDLCDLHFYRFIHCDGRGNDVRLAERRIRDNPPYLPQEILAVAILKNRI